MLLLDGIRDHSGDSIVCSTTPSEATPYAGPDGVPAILALEFMAQTVAAYAGMRARSQGRPVRMGYIIGVRTMSLSVSILPLNEELLVTAEMTWGDDELGRFECSVTGPAGSVAEAQLTVFQGDLENRG
jgi:predicted hotdog family 3-hydroxylacyl-ACP dehydratase